MGVAHPFIQRACAIWQHIFYFTRPRRALVSISRPMGGVLATHALKSEMHQVCCNPCKLGSCWRAIAQSSYVARVIGTHRNYLRTFFTNAEKTTRPLLAFDVYCGNPRDHAKLLPVDWRRSVRGEGLWWSRGTVTRPQFQPWRWKSTDCAASNGGLYNMPVPQLRIVSASTSIHAFYIFILTQSSSYFSVTHLLLKTRFDSEGDYISKGIRLVS